MSNTLTTAGTSTAAKVRQRGAWPAGATEWAIDAGAAAIALACGLLLFLADGSTGDADPSPSLAWELTVGGGAVTAVLLLRRRWPAGLAAVLAVAGMASAIAMGAVFVSLFTVASRRSWRVTVAIAGLHAALVVVLFRDGISDDRQYWETVITLLLVDLVLVASGMLVRSQRLLVRSLRDRSREAEERQRLRIEEARRLERERIAREMHDVLAHRISLLTMHAGALEFRPDAPAAEITRAAGVIRSCAYEALEDLREVIWVLRDETGGTGERPQPTLASLPELIADARAGGMTVTLDLAVDDLTSVPAGVGRHAYRIVQEGLTNARKHAPGAPARVVVSGAPGGELAVELSNPRTASSTAVPGAGAGLIGLQERAELVGGRLEHGGADGEFRLRASLPWPG